MRPRLSRQVIVITGASSGIGRATALEFGKHRASVVLAARNETALREVARRITHMGGSPHVVVTDVADWEQVARLAEEAIGRFGRIDTWINNAAVGEYATVEQMSIEEIDRIIRVNLLGVIYGCKAALPYMKQQRRGTIINVGSALSDRAVPLVSGYVASKFGVKGFTEALRMEQKYQRSGINVTLVLPASINTPMFSRSRSKIGVKPHPIPPVYEPQLVAEAIVDAARSRRRDVYVGRAGKALAVMERISPRLLDWWMVQGGRMFRMQMTQRPDRGRDNLFQPAADTGQVRGEWGQKSIERSPYSRMAQHPRRTGMLLAGAAVGLALLLKRSR